MVSAGRPQGRAIADRPFGPSVQGGTTGPTTAPPARTLPKCTAPITRPAPQQCSPLGRHPYDLRHAAVSLWLSSGVPATEVARRAGHGVAVLLKIYAHCIDGQADAANQRITDALGTKDTQPEPGAEEDGDSKKAT